MKLAKISVDAIALLRDQTQLKTQHLFCFNEMPHNHQLLKGKFQLQHGEDTTLVLVGLVLTREDAWHFTVNKEIGNAEKF